MPFPFYKLAEVKSAVVEYQDAEISILRNQQWLHLRSSNKLKAKLNLLLQNIKLKSYVNNAPMSYEVISPSISKDKKCLKW